MPRAVKERRVRFTRASVSSPIRGTNAHEGYKNTLVDKLTKSSQDPLWETLMLLIMKACECNGALTGAVPPVLTDELLLVFKPWEHNGCHLSWRFSLRLSLRLSSSLRAHKPTDVPPVLMIVYDTYFCCHEHQWYARSGFTMPKSKQSLVVTDHTPHCKVCHKAVIACGHLLGSQV